MRRVWPIQLFLSLVVLAAAGLVGLTYFPESALLEEATSWPLVGPLAQEIRRIYLPPPPMPGDRAPARERAETEDPPPFRRERPPAQVRAFEARPFEYFREGTPVYEKPALEADVILRLDNPARFALFKKRGEWARIRLASREAWIQVNDDTVSLEPPLGREARPVTPLTGRPPDAGRLAEARQLLGGEPSRRRLGPYELLTDVKDRELLAFLDAVVRHHGPAHLRRYGLAPVGEPAAAIVLFSREGDYWRYQRSEKGLEGLRAAGHAGSGIVALPAASSSRALIAGVLVHELTHMLNRRTIGPALPPWLEEGTAEDLGGSRVAESGEILLGSVQSSSRKEGTRIELSGFSASLQLLRRAGEGGGLVPLEELLALDWGAFVGEGRRSLHYAQSAMWIRYLLSPETGYGPRFRAFLEGVARGGPATADSLEDYLGQPLSTLETRFRAWLRLRLQGHRPAGFRETESGDGVRKKKSGDSPG